MVLAGSFNNLFQYSLSMIALGASKENVPWKITELLINKVTDYSKSSDSGKDTRAMSVIALASVQDQYRKAIRTKVIRKAISKLVLHLGKDMNIGADNLYTKSLIMQVSDQVNDSVSCANITDKYQRLVIISGIYHF